MSSLKPTVATRPDRYRARDQALAYHASTGDEGRRSLSQRLELKAVRRALVATGGGHSVLDVPCGTGRIDGLLRAHFDEVVGIDSSVPMLSVYRDRLPGRQGCCADIFALPFADESFDWVVCHRYLHHLHHDEERRRALASLRRVCRQGVVVYAWVNTPLVRRRGTMRTSVPAERLHRVIAEAGLRVDSVHACAGPFSVKSIFVCRR